MKTLSLNKGAKIASKNKALEVINKGNNLGFQDLYSYLNQLEHIENGILISIILPAYNEEKSIKQLLESLPNDKTIEIIVIDDNSTDNSTGEAKKVKHNKNIKLLKHKINKGYGGAIITGINHSNGEVVVTMDSDGQHCPQDILKLVKPIFEHKTDCTIGSRYLGSNHYDLPIRTRLGEAIIEKFLQTFFSQKIMNNQNGFRAFSNRLIPIYVNAKHHGFAYATEMLILTLIEGYKIKEIPVKVYEREYGSSKINLINLLLDLFICFVRYYFRKLRKIKLNKAQ